MRRTMVAALLLLLAPSALLAQGREGRGMRGMPVMNVARVLIENRADLTLSDEQVAQLQVIADSLEQKNAPFVQAMQAMRQSGGRGSVSEADREKMRTDMEQARANSEAARQEIDGVLSAEQRTKAQELRLRAGRRGGGARR